MMPMPKSPIIIVGAGIAGLCATHQALQNGANVILLDKNLSSGGNSRLAETGINGFQREFNSFNLDSPNVFKNDLIEHASNNGRLVLDEHTKRLINLLSDNSIDSISWLETSFDLRFDKIVKTNGSTYKRTLGFQNKGFPGFVILENLLNNFKLKCEQFPEKYLLLDDCKLVDFIMSKDGPIRHAIGIVCELGGSSSSENINLFGPVILATGGFGSSLEFIQDYRHDLIGFATASRESCNSEVVDLVLKHGGKLTNMENYQMIPTGLVPFNSDTTDIKNVNTAPASIINNGILINDQLQIINGPGTSNENICQAMAKSSRNYLILNGDPNYHSIFTNMKTKGYLKKISLSHLSTVLFTESSNIIGLLNSRGIITSSLDEKLSIIQLMPTILIPLGGIKTISSMEIEGLKNCFAAGELVGGIHGSKMIVGSSLLSCVVFGRISAQHATSSLLSKLSNATTRTTTKHRLVQLNNHLRPSSYDQFKIPDVEFTIDEISKHKDINDCWLVIKNVVLDVSKFISNHPGGINSMLINGGCDISNNYDMMHDDSMIFNYARDCVIGKVKGCVPYLEFMDGE